MNTTDHIRRLIRIINKVRLAQPINQEELIEYVSNDLAYTERKITPRTLQRDFNIIASLFNISIVYNRDANGYVAEYNSNVAQEYEALLQNFELLSRIDKDSALNNYVVREHRLPFIGEAFFDILKAIRENFCIEFFYEHYRDNSRSKRHILSPHLLKESQNRWYVVGYNLEDKLRVYAIERISNVSIYKHIKFKRKKTSDVLSHLADSFGIWVDDSIPVEDVVVRYDKLDGAFIKSLPLHSSQDIISEDDCSVTIGLRLRVTNDFVMALLARSRSIEVLEPLSLRQRMESIYKEALLRNKTDM